MENVFKTRRFILEVDLDLKIGKAMMMKNILLV